MSLRKVRSIFLMKALIREFCTFKGEIEGNAVETDPSIRLLIFSKIQKCQQFCFIYIINLVIHRKYSPVFFHPSRNSKIFVAEEELPIKILFFVICFSFPIVLKSKKAILSYSSVIFNSWFCVKSNITFLSRLQSGALRLWGRNWTIRSLSWSFHQTPLSH